MKTKTIVLIHGMFMTPLCWENWVPYYESKGYRVVAPPWPGRDKPIENLRRNHADPRLAELKLSDVVERMERVIDSLEEKPALIGHSMGGLVGQLLLQKDLAVAGVAIDPAPPQGVLTTKWSFIKSNFPAINPLLVNRPVVMSFEHFQYAFVNTLPLDEQRAAYDRYVVPESRRVPIQLFASASKVDFKKQHPPLRITAGEKDHIIPAALVRTNFNRYKNSSSVTDFKEFAGRDHFLIGSPGWQEVADYSLAWLEKVT